MSEKEALKAKAAEYALSFVQDHMVIGLGTGTTTGYFLNGLAKRIKNGKLKNIVGIPSSKKTERIASEMDIPLASFDQYQIIDITVDGADEVDHELNLIKGGGGALLREKVMAQASKRFVIIIDDSKYSDNLGNLFFVPVEVLPYAYPLESEYIKSLGAEIKIRKNSDSEFFKTDQQNYILDCHFGIINDPDQLSTALNQRAGVMAHGLFLNMTTDVVMATGHEVKHFINKNI
jgi:ribose 5-phosphate isomerase A